MRGYSRAVCLVVPLETNAVLTEIVTGRKKEGGKGQITLTGVWARLGVTCHVRWACKHAVDRYSGSGGVFAGGRGRMVCGDDENAGEDLSKAALSTSTGWLVDRSMTRCMEHTWSEV